MMKQNVMTIQRYRYMTIHTHIYEMKIKKLKKKRSSSGNSSNNDEKKKQNIKLKNKTSYTLAKQVQSQ